MKTTKSLENLPITQFYLSCKDLNNPALKRKPALGAAKKDILRETMFAPRDQIRFGRELRKVSKLALRKGEKAKGKVVAEKERVEEMLSREIGKETKRARPEKAKYLANFTALAMDTARGQKKSKLNCPPRGQRQKGQERASDYGHQRPQIIHGTKNEIVSQGQR
jgi:hypothetical protein